MSRRSSFTAAVFIALLPLVASPRALAASVYRQDFPSDSGESLSGINWDDAHIGGNGNTAGVSKNDAGGQYLWWYNNTGLADATTVTGACLTTKLAPIPVSADTLKARWEQRLENIKDDNDTDTTGTPAEVRLAVQVDGKWYASDKSYKTTPKGVGNTGAWEAQELTLDPAAKNWRELTLGSDDAKLGAAPANNLAGNITGIGFVTTFAQHQTVNFHFLDVAPPEGQGGK
jgi:hypothetical protein